MVICCNFCHDIQKLQLQSAIYCNCRFSAKICNYNLQYATKTAMNCRCILKCSFFASKSAISFSSQFLLQFRSKICNLQRRRFRCNFCCSFLVVAVFFVANFLQQQLFSLHFFCNEKKMLSVVKNEVLHQQESNKSFC